MGKSKAHIRYKKKDGTAVPGVTTITGILGWNKRVLINWANKLGLAGTDANKYVDDKASIGSLAHDMILCHFTGKKCDTADYTQNQIDKAENSFLSYLNWEKGKKIEPILVEEPMVSETHSYGGTIDFYGKIDGVKTLLDFKTGSGIYREMGVQVAGGYYNLLEERGENVERVVILNIPRTEDENFQEKEIKEIAINEQIFFNLLNIYDLGKQLGGE